MLMLHTDDYAVMLAAIFAFHACYAVSLIAAAAELMPCFDIAAAICYAAPPPPLMLIIAILCADSVTRRF